MESSPVAVVDTGPRCFSCGKLLFIMAARPWVMDCKRCGSRNDSTRLTDDVAGADSVTQ